MTGSVPHPHFLVSDLPQEGRTALHSLPTFLDAWLLVRGSTLELDCEPKNSGEETLAYHRKSASFLISLAAFLDAWSLIRGSTLQLRPV
ncbi:MAG: hypothetical protein ABSD38_26285 [Syntrophorhabdales bacterium]|jgi:hypothetical protein